MNLPSIMGFAGAAAAAALFFAIIVQDRRVTRHPFLLLALLVLAAESIANALAFASLLPERKLYWENWQLLIESLLPSVLLVFTLTYSRGDARQVATRSLLLLLASFVLPVATAIWSFGEAIDRMVPEPGGHWVFGLGWAGLGIHLFCLVTFIASLMNIERAFTASIGTMRWRIKFLVLGLGLLLAVRSYTTSQSLLFRSITPGLQIANSLALIVACGLMLRWAARISPIEIKLYPSHTVLHRSLTGVLAGIYLVVVGVMSKVVTRFGGDAAAILNTFFIILAVTVLAVLLLSDQVRARLQQLVSRHFQRPLYDYRTVWRRFVESTVGLIEQSDICAAIGRFVSELFQARSVSVWLLDEQKQNMQFMASTFLSDARARELGFNRSETAEVISSLKTKSDPADIDKNHENWAVLLRRVHPDQFHKPGHRWCVPLAARGEMLGFILAGDRFDGAEFSFQDIDLLKAISDQAAVSLLNSQLVQKLSRARQLEAFQTMSAFFVHDLKNTASTLSLMLKNLPVHFNDPAFREDAIRGLGKASQHLNDLIVRLGTLRQSTAIAPIEADLNDLVRSILDDLAPTMAKPVKAGLLPLPKLWFDPSQLQKVIVNLFLNAKEACSNDEPSIGVATEVRDGWAVLSVHDNGCGMTNEFMEKSLFKPFETTKKNGMGIGMFQTKMIVDAHGGRIEVESAPGKGARFDVFLPVTVAKPI
jgi:putative PEP-CTERM system histidine kinase